MCVVCALWAKEKLNSKEARTALRELISTDQITPEHVEEILDLIDESEK